MTMAGRKFFAQGITAFEGIFTDFLYVILADGAEDAEVLRCFGIRVAFTYNFADVFFLILVCGIELTVALSKLEVFDKFIIVFFTGFFGSFSLSAI